MKELIKEFINEKGKELVFISGTIVVVLALVFGHSYITEGGEPYLPENLYSLESKIDRGLSRGLSITNKVTKDLNDLLELEREGKMTEVLAQINEAKEPLEDINSIVSRAAKSIEESAGLISQVKPKRAQRFLSDAMTHAAVLGQNLLAFSQQMDTLYAGLETRARGEGVADVEYARLVQDVNLRVQVINNIQNEYNRAMDQFYQLTDV